jgi:hypothetical protein
MAIITIEYRLGIPVEDFSSADPTQGFIDQVHGGVIIGRTLGIGRNGNIMPQAMRAKYSGIRMPILVDGDGTALLALRKGPEGPVANVVEAVTLRDGEVQADEFLAPGERGLYRLIGMPAQTEIMPFAMEVTTEHGLVPKCYGAVMYKPGPSPRFTITHRTPADISRALNG